MYSKAETDRKMTSSRPTNLPGPELSVPAAAEHYARLGLSIVPLHSAENGICTCRLGRGCLSPAKHPRTRNGLADATCDAARVQDWWRKWPEAGIGMVIPAYLAVVDVDARNGGYESQRELEAKHGPWPPTLRAVTGGGGQHWFYRVPAGTVVRQRSGVLPGIDTRAAGRGYVVLPPSRHASGKQYTWDCHQPPADIPDWFLNLASNSSTRPRRTRVAKSAVKGHGNAVAEPGELPLDYRQTVAARAAEIAARQRRNSSLTGPPLVPPQGVLEPESSSTGGTRREHRRWLKLLGGPAESRSRLVREIQRQGRCRAR